MAGSGGGRGTREIISVGVGEAGTRVSTEIWKQYCREHGIAADGSRTFSERECDEHTGWFFRESEDTRLTPMNLFVDTDPDGIDGILSGEMRSLFDPKHILVGTEDAASNYARSYYSLWSAMKEKIFDRLRIQCEKCDNLWGFMIAHSTGGGTGSGLSSRLLEQFAYNYRKKFCAGFHIYPRLSHRELSLTAHINSFLCNTAIIEYSQAPLVFDNQALCYLKIQKKNKNQKIDGSDPKCDELNGYISEVISSMTCDFRFRTGSGINLETFEARQVNFPRVKFLTPSISTNDYCNSLLLKKSDILDTLTEQCFNPDNFCVDFPFLEPSLHRYEFIGLSHRFVIVGDESEYESKLDNNDELDSRLKKSCSKLKTTGQIQFLDWCPSGIKCSTTVIRKNLVKNTSNDGGSTVAMLANSLWMGRFMDRRVSQPFQNLHRRKCFLHWYFREHMEESQFDEAMEEMFWLLCDYKDVLDEKGDDFEDSGDDEES